MSDSQTLRLRTVFIPDNHPGAPRRTARVEDGGVGLVSFADILRAAALQDRKSKRAQPAEPRAAA